ncbi:HAD family hydrolase [Snodgrassella alvi]|uniref:HAD family hydrolase n=1 Tax=Snodgrassella TaxID=1193515 RepID=UPI003460734F
MNKPIFWFDFGGVLTPPIKAIIYQYQQKTQLPANIMLQAVKDTAAEFGYTGLEPLEIGLISEQEWGRRVKNRLTQLQPNIDTSKADLEHFGRQWFENIQPNTLMIDKVRQLKKAGFTIGLLTNNVREWEAYWRPMINLDDVLDIIVDSCKVGCRKPDQTIFQIAEQQANTTAQHCILIDDTEENCVAAQKRGWQTIHFIDNDQVLKEISYLTANKSLE